MGGSVPRQPTTWLRVSAHRYLVRRTECALLGEAIYPTGPRARMPSASLAAGCVVTVLALAGCALLGLLSPHVALDRAQIVMSRDSGALFVRVGDVWHPVPNLASARLIAGTAADPQPIREADLERAKRGPLLGIPGAPQFVGRPLPTQDVAFSMCDSDGASSTTVIVGPLADNAVTRMPPGQAILAAVSSGSPAYLLYDGHRAIVDLEDAAVVRALRLEGRAPRLISQALLNAMPEAPPISAPRIRGLGSAAPELPGFHVGSVLRVTRADGDEYYAVLADGVQRIGQVAADLMRFSGSQGTVSPVTVAPAAIRAAPVVAELPVAGFPDRAPAASGSVGARSGGGDAGAGGRPGPRAGCRVRADRPQRLCAGGRQSRHPLPDRRHRGAIRHPRRRRRARSRPLRADPGALADPHALAGGTGAEQTRRVNRPGRGRGLPVTGF